MTNTYYATADDLYANSGGVYEDTNASIRVGRGAAGQIIKAYFPFPVDDIAQGTPITAARFILTASQTGTATICKLKYGAADDGRKPANYTELSAKTFADYNTDDNFQTVTAGDVITFDVTNSVQAKINDGWIATIPASFGSPEIPGDEGIIAILLFDNGSDNNLLRIFAANENTTYTEAILEIDFPFTPRIIFT